MTVETVYKGADNPNDLTFFEDGVAIDFSGATRITCEFGDTGVIADSDINPEYFDWTIGDGVVEFKFNDLAIADGRYKVTMKVYDPLHDPYQVLIEMCVHGVQFAFVTV